MFEIFHRMNISHHSLVQDLLSKLLVYDPNSRLTPCQAVNHKFFTGYDQERFDSDNIVPMTDEMNFVSLNSIQDCKSKITFTFIKLECFSNSAYAGISS